MLNFRVQTTWEEVNAKMEGGRKRSNVKERKNSNVEDWEDMDVET